MNFLDLCKATARESGTVAGLPSFSTIAGATGRLDKLVNWVRDAWVNIQNERTDWLFRIATFEQPLTIGTKTYTAGTLGISSTGFIPDTPMGNSMSLYDPAIGQADEGVIAQVSWHEWRDAYDRGVHDANRPTVWAQAPDGSLCIGPKPDKAYTLRGTYKLAPQRLTLDADIPIIPEDFHGVIVGEALRLMADSDEAYEQLRVKAAIYEKLRNPLVLDQTPQVFSVR